MPKPSLSSTLPNVEAFCRTYETASFTKAAQSLGVTPQATSRAVARLEAVLGVTLFRRTTRKLAATDAARRYYEHCARALTLLDEGERALSRGAGGVAEGRVRLSVPTTYGHHRLLPALAAFADRYPEIRVDVGISNRNIDFVADGFDLAIRRIPVNDKTLVARKLGDFSLGVYASRAYLARHGAPKSPADLAAHRCIAFVMPSSGRVLPWTFADGESIVPDGRYRCSEDVLGVITLARAGVGLAQAFDFLVERDVESGALVEVLAAHCGMRRSFALLYPKQMQRSPAVRAMIDFVVTLRA